MPSHENKILQLEEANLKLSSLNSELQVRSKALTERLCAMEVSCKKMACSNAELARARDQALRANVAQNQFLANLSHEIRTPMTGLLGMIDFTLDSELKPDQESQLKIARKAGKELVKVINEIIEFTRAGTAAGAALTCFLPPVAASGQGGGSLTVLVAEDDPIIMKVITLLATRAGHRVIAASNGDEAVRIWESARPDLVFMDVQMPNLDGLEATRRIRGLEQELGGRVPIYGLTAHVLDEDVSRCLVAGMTGHIGKPIDFPDVLETLKRHQCSVPEPVAGTAAPGLGRQNQVN